MILLPLSHTTSISIQLSHPLPISHLKCCQESFDDKFWPFLRSWETGRVSLEAEWRDKQWAECTAHSMQLKGSFHSRCPAVFFLPLIHTHTHTLAQIILGLMWDSGYLTAFPFLNLIYILFSCLALFTSHTVQRSGSELRQTPLSAHWALNQVQNLT